MRRYGVSFLLSFLFFFIGMMFSISSLSFMGVWLGVEIMGMSLFMFFYMYEERVLLMSVFIYFWVSSVSGFGLLFSYYMMDFNQKIFFFFIILKFGLVPFFGWVISVYSTLNFFLLFLMSSFVKLPLFMFLDMFGVTIWLVGMSVGLVSILFGFMGVYSGEIKMVLGFSAIGVMGDLFLFYFFSFDLFVLSFIFYGWFLLMLVLILSSGSMGLVGEGIKDAKVLENVSLLELLFLSMFGLPPFASFFVKLYFFFFMLVSKLLSIVVMSIYFFLMILMSLIYCRFYLMNNFFLFKEWEEGMITGVSKFSESLVIILSVKIYIVSILVIFSFMII